MELEQIELYKIVFVTIVILLIISTPFSLIWGLCHINNAPKGERFKEFLIETGVGIYCGCMYMGILAGALIIRAIPKLFAAAIISSIATFIIHHIDMKYSGSLRDSYWTVEKNYKDFFEVEVVYDSKIIHLNEKYDALSNEEKKTFQRNLNKYLNYNKLSPKGRLFFTDKFKNLAIVFFIVFLIAVALQCPVDLTWTI